MLHQDVCVEIKIKKHRLCVEPDCKASAHRKLIGGTILAIETDEFGHRGYDPTDEEIRYDDVYMIHSGK